MAISLTILGRRLKQVRQKRRLTQEQAAERIGFSVAHLSKIERGMKPINVAKLAELCDVLDVPLEWVVSGASLPQNTEYNRLFSEIAQECTPATVEAMLEICRQVARVEKRG